MKIGLFWVCEPDKWIQYFANRLSCEEKLQIYDIGCFSLHEIGSIKKINRHTYKWPYQAINDLVDVYQTAIDCGIDFALISFGRGLPINLALLERLLASSSLQNCVWSMRIAEISGIGVENSPRLPFIDDHFIVLNVGRAQEKEFFKRHLIHASHFSSVGNHHAELISMIECSVGKDELNNHFVAQACHNQYGQSAKLNPFPFNMCEATGFLTCYPEFQPSLDELIKRNLRLLLSGRKDWPSPGYALKRGYWYFRFEPCLKKAASLIRLATHDIAKYEFKKRFDRESK